VSGAVEVRDGQRVEMRLEQPGGWIFVLRYGIISWLTACM